MKCLVIEDQPPAQRILQKFIADYGSLELVATFPDALQALALLQKQAIDLLFLDINLPKLSGIDFLKSLANPPQVIFTTAYSDYALESYELNVVDYLLKPFSFQRFVKAVSKAQALHSSSGSATIPFIPPPTLPAIFIKSGYEHIQVKLAELIYLQSDTDYTELVLPDKKILSAESLKYWEQELPSKYFLRVHRSYIVHLPQIDKVVGSQIMLHSGQTIPLGRAYRERFFAKLSDSSSL